MSWEDSK